MKNNDLQASIAGMQKAVRQYAEDYLERCREKETAKQGTVRGSRIYCGNRSYGFVPAVDEYFADGDTVWFVLSDAGTAVVVGV